MSQDPPKPPPQTGLVLQRPAGLATLPHGNSPALSEIINRSLVHLRTSQSPATRHREPGEECEFEIAPGVMMRMCWIPQGEFLMDSSSPAVTRQLAHGGEKNRRCSLKTKMIRLLSPREHPSPQSR